MKKRKIVYFDLDLLPSSVMIFFNFKEKDKSDIYDFLQANIKTLTRSLSLIKKIDELNLDEDRGYSIESGPIQLIIIKDFNSKKFEDITLFNHEMQHLVYGIGNYIGSVYSTDSEEFYTNIQENLSNKILKLYNGGDYVKQH
jgi:hypothetical protein